jgi:TctA family transporter
MKFIKRRGSSTAKLTVANFEAMKEQFIIDVNAVVEMEDIPPQLVFNWDHTGISIVPSSQWTMEAKGSKRVEIVRSVTVHTIILSILHVKFSIINETAVLTYTWEGRNVCLNNEYN